MLLRVLQCTGQHPVTKNYSAPGVNRADVALIKTKMPTEALCITPNSWK